jgi:hypothetical protein
VNSRRLKLLVLLLPLFIARSLLPIGFMVSFDTGTAQLVFCPGEAPSQNHSTNGHSANAAHHEHHHSHGSDDTGTGGTEHSHQTCPFAAASAAPFAVASVFAADPQVAEAIAAPLQATIPTLVFRAHPIRGPPALS